MAEDKGKKPYGNVTYGDPGYQDDGKKRYPLDTEEHCRAAWSYINQADNADKYTPDQLRRIKNRIKAAGRRYGIEFAEDESRSIGTAVRHTPGGVPHNQKDHAGDLTPGHDFERMEVTPKNVLVGDLIQAVGDRSAINDKGWHAVAKVERTGSRFYDFRDRDGRLILRVPSGSKVEVRRPGSDDGHDSASRSVADGRPTYERDWALDDIHILRGGPNGDGRTVEAYASVFDTPTEVKDQYGHYMEEIARTAFNRTLSHGIGRVNVFYNHGKTIFGTPSDLGSVPIARPLEIRPDGRGLRTVSRYNRSQLADSVLESIRNDEIKGYSFRGGIFRSNPARIPRVGRDGTIPRVVRLELGLTEYGPTPVPYYPGAEITAIRAAGTLTQLPADERRELIRILSAATPGPVPAADTLATPNPGPGAEDPHHVHSGRLQRLARFRARAQFEGVLLS